MSNSKSAGIYSITSKVNGKRYIGSSNRICDRWRSHTRDLVNNKHNNPHLQGHYNKYGKDDLLFAVVEIVERGDLSLQDFKNLLLEREQVYLDNWEECHFNIQKTATSCVGSKQQNAKYYKFSERDNKYVITYRLNGKATYFGWFDTEQEAIKEVAFIKSLCNEELTSYHKSKFKGKGRNVGSKNYRYSRSKNKFYVSYNLNYERLVFGHYLTEDEAINVAQYIETLSDEDKIKYYETNFKGRTGSKLGSRNRDNKGYFYDKTFKKWKVCFKIDGVIKRFGSFKTEEEARQKAEQVKQELGGFY